MDAFLDAEFMHHAMLAGVFAVLMRLTFPAGGGGGGTGGDGGPVLAVDLSGFGSGDTGQRSEPGTATS